MKFITTFLGIESRTEIFSYSISAGFIQSVERRHLSNSSLNCVHRKLFAIKSPHFNQGKKIIYLNTNPEFPIQKAKKYSSN